VRSGSQLDVLLLTPGSYFRERHKQSTQMAVFLIAVGSVSDLCRWQ
jgi:hypothetical protein